MKCTETQLKMHSAFLQHSKKWHKYLKLRNAFKLHIKSVLRSNKIIVNYKKVLFSKDNQTIDIKV